MSHPAGSAQGHAHGHAHGSGWKARIKDTLIPHSHDANESIQSAEESSADGIRAAWIGLAGMMITALLQVAIVAISGSIALLADTIHNLGHAATTIPLIIAFKLGSRKPTRRYSYGFRRAEDLVGVFISLVIALSAALIIWESIRALIDPRPLTNLWWVLGAGFVGAAGNELVAVYRIRAGRRIGSAALIAEGQHARADGLTSLAVVVGVIGVWLGFPQADAIVGLLISVAIIWILINSLRTITRRLMDGVEPGIIDQIFEVADTVPGVHRVAGARARWSGHRLEADLEVSVDSTLSVLEGHALGEEVHHALLHQVQHLDRAVVHVNPVIDGREPDELHELSAHHASKEAREQYRAQMGPRERAPSHQGAIPDGE